MQIGMEAPLTARRGAQYATFRLKGMYFGIDVLEVQEILRPQEMTAIPLAPSVVEGLINLRGQIVTAIDMRRRLDIESRPESAEPMNIVIRTDDSAVSLLVDEIGDVVSPRPEDFESPPPNTPASCRGVIDGVFKMDGEILLVLNTRRALERTA